MFMNSPNQPIVAEGFCWVMQDPHSLLGENRLGLYLGPDIDFGIKRIKPASSQLSAKTVARLYADLAGHQLHDSSAPEASLLLNLLCGGSWQRIPHHEIGITTPSNGKACSQVLHDLAMICLFLLRLPCCSTCSVVGLGRGLRTVRVGSITDALAEHAPTCYGNLC